jgi:hypothetical protein
VRRLADVPVTVVEQFAQRVAWCAPVRCSFVPDVFVVAGCEPVERLFTSPAVTARSLSSSGSLLRSRALLS